MKKLLSFIAVFILFTSINTNAANTKVSTENELLAQSCFSFIHDIYVEYFGGINIDNVADFNAAVAYCQANLE